MIKRRHKVKHPLFISLMLLYPILHFLIFFVYINFDTILMTFQRFNMKTNSIEWAGFDNYIRFFKLLKMDPILLYSIKNSLILFPVTNFVTLPLAFIVAYFMYKKIPCTKFFRIVLFFPSIISVTVMVMCFSFMFNSTFGPIHMLVKFVGLKGNWLGRTDTSFVMVLVYCIWAGIGFDMIVLNGAISRISEEIMEYGRLEGIGMGREMFGIVFPLVFDSISTLCVIGTTSVFTLFIQPMLLTGGGPQGSSSTIALYIMTQMKSFAKEEMAATIGTIFAIIGTPIVFAIKLGLEKISERRYE